MRKKRNKERNKKRNKMRKKKTITGTASNAIKAQNINTIYLL